jgi:peptide deformylase
MVFKVVQYGNPILRKMGEKISKVTEEIRTLSKDMLETMRHYEGVGLAAQQIGKALQFAVIDVSGVEDRPSKMWINKKEVNPLDYMPLMLINPEVEQIKTKEIGTEGCLSFPGISADISRSKRVSVKTWTLDQKVFEFEAAGLLGRAVQHEYDHLQGILFTDRMTSADKKLLKDDLEAIRLATEKA